VGQNSGTDCTLLPFSTGTGSSALYRFDSAAVDVIVPETTKVLDAESRSVLTSASSDFSTMSFSTTTTELAGVGQGDVLVSEPTTVAPDGFLRRVLSVEDQADGVSVETTAAALEEAVTRGSASYDATLVAPQVREVAALRPGVKVAVDKSDVAGAFVDVGLTDVVLYDGDGNPATTNDQVVAKGSIRFEPNLHFSAQVHNAQLETFEFKVTVDETARLEVGSKVDLAQFSAGPFELARVDCNPITLWMGPVPLILTPHLTVTIGGDGKVTVGIGTAVTQHATFAGGVAFNNGTWTPIWSFTNTFGFESPTVTLEARAQVWAAANVDVMVYGVAGPYLTARRYFVLDVKPLEAPWWTLTGGFKVDAGVQVDIRIIFKRLAFGYSENLVDRSEVIAHASNVVPLWHVPLLELLSGVKRVVLSWVNPDIPNFGFTRILRSESSYATTSTPSESQIQAYEGTGTAFADTDLTDGKTYYYTAFARDEEGNWSAPTTASATPGVDGPGGNTVSTPASSSWTLALLGLVSFGLLAFRRREVLWNSRQ
jgi:MYXO-CTERM domain-containing protein